MRKEAKKTHRIDVAHVMPYHHGSHPRKLVYASDRPQEADSHYHLISDGSLPSMYGLEVETQNWGITDRTIYANLLKGVCFKTFHSDLWKIERDISLEERSDTSAECITQPMTKAYIRNHYADFKAMFDWFGNLGISCDKTGDCGMHVHISLTCFGREKKTQDEAIRKFTYIVNTHYDLMRTVVHRRLDHYNGTGYFGKMNISRIKEANLSNFRNDHGDCVNLGHYDDQENIELRLVGGQHNFPCFRNTMESVFHLVEISKSISWADCDDITKVFKGCNNYVYDRLASHVLQANQITTEQLEKIHMTMVNKEFI